MKLFGRKPPPDDQPVDLDERSPQLGMRNKDLLVLHQLIAAGANLTEPRHVSYYMYFDSSERADAAATRVSHAERPIGTDRRIDTHLLEESGERPWSVVFETIAVLDPPTVIAADDFLQSLADDLGGIYDGWEASVVEMTSLP